MVITLQNLNRPEYLENPQLLEDIEAKLPTMMSMLWANAVVGLERYSIVDLNRWINQQARVLCMRITPKEVNEEKKENKKNFTHKVYSAVEDEHSKLIELSVDDRWEEVKRHFLCFSCLGGGHTIFRCRKRRKCGIDGCTAWHHNLLHPAEKEIVKETTDEREVCQQTTSGGTNILLKIVPITLRFGDRHVVTSALLDSGSTVTLLRADIANDLGAKGLVKPLCLQWANGNICTEQKSELINIDVVGHQRGARSFVMKGVKSVSKLPLHRQSVDKMKLINDWPYLNGIPFDSYLDEQPGILIGEDNAFILASHKVIRYKPHSPIATKTLLGWVISGNTARTPVSPNENSTTFSYHICDNVAELDELHRLVKGSFALEEFGVKSGHMKGRSREDERALNIMENTASRIECLRWEVGLLWRNDNEILPESKNMAMMRLRCLERLDSNSVLKAAYNDKINDYIKKGYFVKVEENECANRRWYLPHFAVTNQNKPNKLRIVFDAAAKSHGKCLNDFLLQGPDLLKPLPSVLFRFRQRKIGFVGDIKEMYHRVGIRAVDQNCQLILWRGENRNRQPDVYKMTAMTFGASCSPSAAMFVKDRNALEFIEKFPNAVKVIVDNHYVDDCLSCADDEASAKQIIQDVSYIHAQGVFEIRNWSCTSAGVLSSIPAVLRVDTPMEIKPDNMERVLGIWWIPTSDMFTFRFKHHKYLDNSISLTKRQILRILITIFDPLGMLAHILIQGRIIMQWIWKSGVDWDDELTPRLAELWRSWLNEVTKISEVQLPRCYSSMFSTSDNVQLHIFCDASEEAYCAVA